MEPRRTARHHQLGTQAGRQVPLRDLAVSTLREVDPPAAAPVDTAPVAMAPAVMAPEVVVPVAVDPEAMTPVGMALGADPEVSQLVAGVVPRVETLMTPLRVRPAWGCRTLRIRPE